MSIDHDDIDGICGLLMGHRIVAATEGVVVRRWSTDSAGILTLDDGTTLNVIPNRGGCCCGAGDYEISALNRVDNIITGVEVITDDLGEYGGTRYIISVFAGDEQINAVEIEGDDGNGYYGTGFEIEVALGDTNG